MKLRIGPAVLFVLLASVSGLSAQTATPTPDVLSTVATPESSLDNALQSLPRLDAEEAALPGAVIKFPTQQPPANSGTLKFILSDVAIEGAEILPRDSLQSIYAEMIGEEITLLEAFDILAKVQVAHREAGFIFTRVVAPPQSIDDGVFTIRVVEAVIGDVIIEEPEGSVGKPLPLIEKIAGELSGVQNPTLGQLERVLLTLNDIPGITQATAVPRPGKGLGAVDIFINVVRDPFSGVFFGDNRQSPILGPLILGVSLEASSWTAAGDTTTLSLFTTGGDRVFSDFDERNIIQLEHLRYIGSKGTTFKARALASRNDPGDVLEPTGIDGRQFGLEGTLEHPVIRTRPLSIWASAGFEAEDNVVETRGGVARVVDDSLRVADLGGRVLQRDAYGYTRADIQLRQGIDGLGSSNAGDVGLSRFDGVPDFTSLSGSIDREIILPFADRKISLFGTAIGQISSRPVLSSEEFAVGGQLVGRAYDPSEFTGDSGFGLLGEIRFQTEFDAMGTQIGAQFYGYADLAEVHNRGTEIDSENLKSYGGGIRLSLPYEASLSGEVAVPLQPLQRNNEENPRFFVNVVKRF